MPGGFSWAESYTPSLIWKTRSCPSEPAATSGENEIQPAGTGSLLKVTLPDSWPGAGLDEQPAASDKKATTPRNGRSFIVRLPLPICAEDLTAVGRAGPLEGEGA